MGKKGNVVTVLTEPDDEEEDVLILGRGTQHYAIVEDKVPLPAHVFIGTRVIAKQLDTDIFAFAEVVRITDDDKYFVTFQDNKRQSALTTIDFIRLLYPPTFCGKSEVLNMVISENMSIWDQTFRRGNCAIFLCVCT